MLHVTASFRALDVGRGVVGDPGVIGHEDSGFYEHGVLAVKGEVSIWQEQRWAARGRG